MAANQWFIIAGLVVAVLFFSSGLPFSVVQPPLLRDIQAGGLPSLTDYGSSNTRACFPDYGPTNGADYALDNNPTTGKWVLNGVELSRGALVGDDYTDPLVRVERRARGDSYKACGGPTYSYRVVQSGAKIDWNKQGCAIGGTELLFATTLRGGDTTSVAELSKLAPVKRFCARIPAVFTNDVGASGVDAQIYYDLLSNSAVVVPASRTYTVFWVTDQQPQVFFKCGENFGYDSEQLACVPTTGFAYACPAGSTYRDNKCFVQPEVFCPAGTNYNGAVCVAPVVYDCQSYYGANSSYAVVDEKGVCKVEQSHDQSCSSLGAGAYEEYRGADKHTCVVVPTVLRAPRSYDCSSYGATARYNGSHCVDVPSYSPDRVGSGVDTGLVVLVALIIAALLVLRWRKLV